MNIFSDNKKVKSTNKTIRTLYLKQQNETLSPHICQRNIVWKKANNQELITHIQSGYPVAGIYMNKEDNKLFIIDGCNRLYAIFNFIDNKYPMNAFSGPILFKNLIPEDQERFLNTDIHIIQLDNWDEESCENYFNILQSGMKLVPGEILHSLSSNILNFRCNNLFITHSDMFESKIKDGGFGITPLKMKRFLYLELISCWINMVLNDVFPQREGPVTTKLMKYTQDIQDVNNEEEVDTLETQMKEACKVVSKCIKTYSQFSHSERCDRLKMGSNKSGIVACTTIPHIHRSMFFIFKKKLYNKNISSIEERRFGNMLRSTHTDITPDDKINLKTIKDLSTSSSVKDIYDIYNNYYEL
jgi:hypothetical protein